MSCARLPLQSLSFNATQCVQCWSFGLCGSIYVQGWVHGIVGDHGEGSSRDAFSHRNSKSYPFYSQAQSSTGITAGSPGRSRAQVPGTCCTLELLNPVIDPHLLRPIQLRDNVSVVDLGHYAIGELFCLCSTERILGTIWTLSPAEQKHLFLRHFLGTTDVEICVTLHLRNKLG